MRDSFVTGLGCVLCGARYEADDAPWRCGCGSRLLNMEYDYEGIAGMTSREAVMERPPEVLTRWRELLPVRAPSPAVSLGERETALVTCPALAEAIGIAELYVKNETTHPTGSFKDRSMAVAVTRAVEVGASIVAIPSTGNAAVAAAAYAARGGLRCILLAPAATSPAKLAQATAHGATVVLVEGGFDEVVALYEEAMDRTSWFPVGIGNHYRWEGDKTIAFEIAAQLGWKLPDRVVCPTGSGQALSRVWKGFRELHRLGWIDRVPRMTAVQAAAANAIERAFRRRERDTKPISPAPTVASGIAVGDPMEFGRVALEAINDTGGTVLSLSEEDIRESQKLLARKAGVYAEAAGAVAAIGLVRLKERGELDPGETVVAIATSHGLKESAGTDWGVARAIRIRPHVEELLSVLSSIEGEDREGTAIKREETAR